MNKGGLVLVVVVDYLVGDGFIGVGLSRIRRPYEGFGDALEEAGILQKFVNIVDNVNSTLIVAERYRQTLSSVLTRTFLHDSISRLDDFVREYCGLVGEAMDYVYEELGINVNDVHPCKLRFVFQNALEPPEAPPIQSAVESSRTFLPSYVP